MHHLEARPHALSPRDSFVRTLQRVPEHGRPLGPNAVRGFILLSLGKLMFKQSLLGAVIHESVFRSTEQHGDDKHGKQTAEHG